LTDVLARGTPGFEKDERVDGDEDQVRQPEITGGDPSRLRRLNALMIIRALRGSEALTVSQLVGITGLSRPAVEDVVSDLVEQGWVDVRGPVAVAMGRPARRYGFRSDARHVLGVDAGAHKVSAIFADLDGTVLSRARVSVPPDTSPRRRLAMVERAIGDCLAAANFDIEQLSAVGVATTGLVDERGVVTLATGIPGWAGVNLAGHVGGVVGCPVVVENDSKLAALAERWRGAAEGSNNMVYILAGMRTAAGLIIGGELHRGFSGAAGEIGMLPEARWSVAQERLLRYASTGAGAEAASSDFARDVFDSARAGVPAALKAVRLYVRELAVGVSALVLALDPELVVVGGGYSQSGEVLLEPLRQELAKRCIRSPTVVASTLGDEAPAFGAVRLALDVVEQEAFAVEPAANTSATRS